MTNPDILIAARRAVELKSKPMTEWTREDRSDFHRIPAFWEFASALLSADDDNQRMRKALETLSDPTEHKLFDFIDVTLFARKALTPE